MSYTKAEEQIIRDNEPVTLEVAERLGSQFGKTTRSVISKSVMLKVYKAKPKAFPQDRATKADTVRAIEKALALGKGELEGFCLLYTSPSPRDLYTSRMPSSA